jgi:hypothetical protein
VTALTTQLLAVVTCSIAEFHKRDPSEDPFEEGDIVAFGSHGLTRKTTAARQLGVISRRAIVKGSRPADPAVMSDFDAVAYMGIVPVKLRGPAYRDDFVVPSGKVGFTSMPWHLQGYCHCL